MYRISVKEKIRSKYENLVKMRLQEDNCDYEKYDAIMEECKKEIAKHNAKLEKRRIFFAGGIIRKFEDIAKYDYVYCNGKLYHRGWVLSWQFNYVITMFTSGSFRYAHKKKGKKTSWDKKLGDNFGFEIPEPNLKPYTEKDVEDYKRRTGNEI